MKFDIIKSATLVVAMLFSSGLCMAATEKAPAAGEIKADSKAKAANKGAKAAKAKAAAKVKLVDINSAGEAELKTLPGVSDADAEKIIAGRPYLSKANLVTHNIVSKETYVTIKALVIAKQNKTTAAKLSEMEKKR